MIEVHDRLYLRLDAEGRWSAFGEGGVLFRRGVDGSVVRPRGTGIETTTPAEAETIHGWVVRRAGELLEVLAEIPASDLELRGDAATLRAQLARAACADADASATRQAAFAEAYAEPVPILPPHRYRDLVVQPATGCPNHRCTFCAFYRDQPFHVLDDAAFAAHLEAVRRLFGAALAERDGVFLGSASAASIPDAVLLPRIRQVSDAFGRPRRGIACFHDPDHAPARDVAAWASLRDAGLEETTLGLETGLASLRREIGKGGDLERFAAAVERQKAAGLGVSLTVLVGLGGAATADAHREATVAFLGRLPLSEDDRVYLSPLGGPGGAGRAFAGEIQGWRRALASLTPARLGEYRIERFAFLA